MRRCVRYWESMVSERAWAWFHWHLDHNSKLSRWSGRPRSHWTHSQVGAVVTPQSNKQPFAIPSQHSFLMEKCGPMQLSSKHRNSRLMSTEPVLTASQPYEDVYHELQDSWDSWLSQTRNAKMEQITQTRQGLRRATERMDQLSRSASPYTEIDLEFDNCAHELIKCASQLDCFGLSSVFVSSRRVGYVNSLLLQTFAKVAENKGLLKVMRPEGLSMIIHSIGVLTRDWRKGRTWGNDANPGQEGLFDGVDHFVDLLLQECKSKDRLLEFNGWSLTNIVYGSCFLDIARDVEYKPTLDAAIHVMMKEVVATHRLKEFNEQEIAMIVYALSRLKYNEQGVLDILFEEIVVPDRLSKYKPQELSNIFYSLAVTGCQEDGIFRQLSIEILKPERLPLFKEQELANITYSLGLIGHGNQAILNGLAGEIVSSRRLRHYSEQELCCIIWAFGKLDYLNAGALRTLLEEVLKTERLDNIKEQGVSNIMYGMACVASRLTIEFSRAELIGFIQKLVELAQLPKRMRTFNSQNLANMGWSIAQLGFHDDRFLKRIVDRYLRMGDKEAYSLKAQSMMLHTCGTFRLKHPYFVDVIIEWLQRDLKKLHPASAVTKILKDVTLAGGLMPDLFLKLCLHLQTLMSRGDKPTVRDWGEMFVAIMQMKTYQPETVSHAVWDRIFMKAKNGWAAKKRSNYVLVDQVSEALTHWGVRHECGGSAVDGQLPVDIIIDNQFGNITIEVDGPLCYACNKTDTGDGALGITEWRNSILRGCGWKVCAIPDFEWNGKSKDEQRRWLKNQLEQIGVEIADAAAASEKVKQR